MNLNPFGFNGGFINYFICFNSSQSQYINHCFILGTLLLLLFEVGR